jgi:hypothetical protein
MSGALPGSYVPAASGVTGAMFPIGTINWVTSIYTGGGFYSIPQTFQDLYMVMNLQFTTATGLAGDLSGEIGVTSESVTRISQTSSGAPVATSIINYPYAPYTGVGIPVAPNWATIELFFPNYANTTSYKQWSVKTSTDTNGSGSLEYTVGKVTSLPGLNSIGFSTANGGIFFAAGSTATLYGIRAQNQ